MTWLIWALFLAAPAPARALAERPSGPGAGVAVSMNRRRLLAAGWYGIGSMGDDAGLISLTDAVGEWADDPARIRDALLSAQPPRRPPSAQVERSAVLRHAVDGRHEDLAKAG